MRPLEANAFFGRATLRLGLSIQWPIGIEGQAGTTAITVNCWSILMSDQINIWNLHDQNFDRQKQNQISIS